MPLMCTSLFQHPPKTANPQEAKLLKQSFVEFSQNIKQTADF